MRIELQNAAGEPVRDVDVPRVDPFPDVVTLGARAYRYHETLLDRLLYRECFAMTLEGYLPGGGMRDGRQERA